MAKNKIQPKTPPLRASKEVQEMDDRIRQLVSPYLQSKLQNSDTEVKSAYNFSIHSLSVGEEKIRLRKGQDPQIVVDNFLQNTANLDQALEMYFSEAYEHVKKHSGVTYEEFVTRASDSIANNIFAFDRPTNVANLQLAGRLGEGVGSGKPIDIKGKTAEKSAAAGLIPVDQKKSKLFDRGRFDEIAYYNAGNQAQLKPADPEELPVKLPVAVATHLEYKDGRKWYYDSRGQEYYQMPNGEMFKSGGDPDVYNIATDTKISDAEIKANGIKPLLVMGDPKKDGQPYKGDIDHGMNAFTRQYYEMEKKEIKPQWMTIGDPQDERNFGYSTPEQRIFSDAEMVDKKLDTMIRHSAENFFASSNHHIIQEDLAQGVQLMMPNGSTMIIHADVANGQVGRLDPTTLKMKYSPPNNPPNNPLLDAEEMLVEQINGMSKTHAVFPNPRWGWQVSGDGFSIPENRIDFKKMSRQTAAIESKIKMTESDLAKDDIGANRERLSGFHDNQKAQLGILQNINTLYSSIIAYQFNQAIFDNKSEYRDEVAGVVVDAQNYQKAVGELQNLNQQFRDARVECNEKFGQRYQESELDSSLFSQGGDKLMDRLRNFNLDKTPEKVPEKDAKTDPKAPQNNPDSWVNRVSRGTRGVGVVR